MKKNIFFAVIFRILSVLTIFLFSGQSYSQQDSKLDICTEFLANSTISGLQFDPATCKCYVDIKYNWPYIPTGANPYDLPYGIDVAAYDLLNPDAIGLNTNVVKINSFNTWTTCTPAANNPDAFSPYVPHYFYGWRTSGTTSTLANAIPSTSTLKLRVYLNFQSATQIKVWFRVLNWRCKDPAFASNPENWYTCGIDKIISKPLLPLQLSVDCPQVCSPSNPYTILHLIPSQAQTNCNQWDWYRYKLPAGGSCPSTNPWSASWGSPIQHCGNELQTGIMDASYCYAVKLTRNCFTYVTPSLQVTVCPDPSLVGGITLSPVMPPGPGNLKWIADSAAYYACGSWLSGSSPKTFTAPDMGFCATTVKWYIDSTGTWLGPLNTTNQYILNATALNIRFSCPLTKCYKIYNVKAEIIYNCCVNGVNTQQVVPRTVKIVINSPTKPGVITSERWNMCGPSCPGGTPTIYKPVLCYDRGTILHYIGTCYKIDRWDSTSVTGWVQIQGAGNQSDWWTNKLRRTTEFTVTMHNGVCPSATTLPIKVRVKPKLKVTIAGCKMIYPGQNPILTATTSYNPPGYYVEYYWYKDGILMVPQPPPPRNHLHVTTPGNYAVQVKDPVCGTDTLSNTITVCKPDISFAGRPCFCDSQTFTITAVPDACFLNNCPNITYSWTGPVFSSTSATITNGTTGVYTVTVNCGDPNCPCTLSKSITITNCP